MRTGVMSDQYIRSTHKMFFLDPLGGHTEKKGKMASLVKQKTAIPFYDIYQDAQRTMQNPYELGAHDLVVNYEKSGKLVKPAFTPCGVYCVTEDPTVEALSSTGSGSSDFS